MKNDMESESEIVAQIKEQYKDTYHNIIFTLVCSLDEYKDKLKETQKECGMWKANHDEMVARNALLRQRPDLPVDRIPAHIELSRLQEEIKSFKNKYGE